MTPEEYLKERLDDQITWYGRKSSKNKNMFKLLSVLLIIAATTIPFLTGYISETPVLKFVVGLLGVVVAIISGIISLNKYQENWIQYRTTCESLKHHKYLFETKSKPYNNDDAFQQLVNNIESIVSRENSQWSNYFKQATDTQDSL